MLTEIKAIKVIGAFCLSAVTGVVHAEGLMDVYRLAEQRDPVYAAAQHEREAVYTLNRQALGVLLPSIDFDASATYLDQEIESDPVEFPAPSYLPSFLTGGSSQIEQGGEVEDTDWSYGVKLRQPIFVAEAIARYGQAKRQVSLADVQFSLAQQNLILRVAGAYFDVLLADRQLGTAQAEKRAIEQQLAFARRSFEVGTASVNDINEAQARFDLATANVLQRINDLAIAERELTRITGEPVGFLARFAEELPLVGPEPNDLEVWLERGRVGSLLRTAQELGVEVAEKEIDARQGARLPTLFFVAGYDVRRNNRPSLGGDVTSTDTDTASIGVQLSVPLFRGGLLSAQVDEAAARYSQAKSQLVDATRQAELLTSQAFLELNNSIARVQALQQALKSSQTALESTQIGRDVGIRTNVDVLNALQQVFSSQRDLDSARYGYVLSRLNLQAAVGTLGVQDLQAVDVLLTETAPGDSDLLNLSE
ncbi:MAG: TolC family outer membrane protein [Pseudomonadota bacterium]|nr:TolC family outer membrane protein [Pseudomonadota bacterium]